METLSFKEMTEAGRRAETNRLRARTGVRRGGSVREVLKDYLDARSQSAWPISVAAAVQTIRAALPECTIEDEDLAELVGITAVEKGLGVSFDADRIDAGLPLMPEELPPPRHGGAGG